MSLPIPHPGPLTAEERELVLELELGLLLGGRRRLELAADAVLLHVIACGDIETTNVFYTTLGGRVLRVEALPR